MVDYQNDDVVLRRPIVKAKVAWTEALQERYPGLTRQQAREVASDINQEILGAIRRGSEIGIAEPLGNGKFHFDVLSLDEQIPQSLKREKGQ